MPNWCENKIWVRGNTSELDRLVEFISSEEREFDFQKVLPYPEDSDINEHDWRIDNWGTRSQPDEPLVYVYGGEAEIGFLTAWSPSLGITQTLSELFPRLEFEHGYEEGGEDFSGVFYFVNGEITEQKQGCFGDIRIFEDDYYDWALKHQ